MSYGQQVEYLYEDEHILVCRKPAGLAVQSAGLGTMDLESLLMNHLAEQAEKKSRAAKEPGNRQRKASEGGRPWLGVVHRLDQPVEGLLVFAKNQAAAASLSRQVQDGRMKKEYLALVTPAGQGRTLLSELGTDREMCLEDWLIKDGKAHVSRVARAGEKNAKKAVLYFSCLPEDEWTAAPSAKDAGQALLRIRLITGRHHQIRVQLSHAGLPIAGDRKYGGSEGRIPDPSFVCLSACQLSFVHPASGKPLSFRMKPSFLL